jgi:hypothetical protein
MSFKGLLEKVGLISDAQNTGTKAGQILDAQVSQNLVALLGTMRAGKTTHVAGLVATAQYKASESLRTNNRFRCLINEGSTNILHDVAELRAGHFPDATTAGKRVTVKPGLTLEWEEPTLFGQRFLTTKKQALMPILDLAGEDLVQLIAQVKQVRTFEQASEVVAADQLTSIEDQCSALLITVNAMRAEGLPCYEPEPTAIKGMSSHSDANLARMILAILQRKHSNPYVPKLKQFFIVVTAADVLFPYAKTIQEITGRPFDPLNPQISSESLDSFLKAFFPSTHSTIASLNVPVKYFPSFFEIEKKPDGTPVYWEGTKSPKIKTKKIFDSPDWEHNVNRPTYSEYWFDKEIEALKEFANMVK